MFKKIADKTPEQLMRDEIELWRGGRVLAAALMVALFIFFVVYVFTYEDMSGFLAVFFVSSSLVSGFAAVVFEAKQHRREYEYKTAFTDDE